MNHSHDNISKFDEKILYKTHQHWIILFIGSLKLIIVLVLPISVLVYFFSNYSLLWTSIIFLLLTLIVSLYDHYLWKHSWLFVGNQKVTLSVRNGMFSQYAMNIRYRNIRDCAISKHSIWSFMFKYGTIFIRSSANEGDFRAAFVPKAGKVYALVNALSRYNDDERSHIDTIETLHNYHTSKEFTQGSSDTLHSKNH